MNSQQATATAQTATAGDRPGPTHLRAFEKGNPPSRAKAYAILEADINAPSPHPYIAAAIPTPSAAHSQRGRTAASANGNAPSPFERDRRRVGHRHDQARQHRPPGQP